MEKIIKKYTFIKATEDEERSLMDELNDLDMEEVAKKTKLSDFKNIIKLFSQKICTKDYVAKVARDSPGCYMSGSVVRSLESLYEYCTENNKFTESEGLDCIFDLIIDILSVTPGLGHYQSLEKLTKIGEMSNYLANLKGEKLKQYASALQKHIYIKEEEYSMEDWARLMNSYMSHVVEWVIDDREDHHDTDIWAVFLDLYLFYLLHTHDVPEELHESMGYCGNVFWYKYDRNPYKGFKDTNVLEKHIEKLEKIISSPKFSMGKQQLKAATEYVEILAKIESEQFEVVMPSLMVLFKSLCLSKGAKDKKDMIEGFKYMFDRIGEKALQNNPLFETWANTVIEILEKMEDKTILSKVLPRMISDLDKKYKPKKGDEKIWINLIKGMWPIPRKDIQQKVKDILDNKKLKRLWNWKENINDAKSMITALETLELPTEDTCDDHWEIRDTGSACGKAVEELLKMFKILKIQHLIMPEIMKMSMTHLEKKTVEDNGFVDKYLGEVELEKNTDIIPEVLKRLEPLVYDLDYPWEDGWCRSNGIKLMDLMMESYKTTESMPDEVNEGLIRIIKFSMEDDREHINLEDGSVTLYAMNVTRGTILISKHARDGTGPKALPVLKEMLKFKDSDNELLKEQVPTAVSVTGACCPELAAGMLEELIDWYIEDKPSDLMSAFMRVFVLKPDIVKKKLDPLIDACRDDPESYQVQVSTFYMLSEKHPEVINAKMVDFFMNVLYHQEHSKPQVIMVMANGAKVYPELFENYMDQILNDKTITSMEQHWLNQLIVSVAKKLEKFKKPVFNYLMGVLKIAKDDTRYTVTLTALQDMCIRYGPDMFEPHKDYLIQKRDSEQSTSVQQGFSTLIDQIEGRSLETVAQDVKETQDDVDQLDERVTGNEASVAVLTTRVDEHEENIDELGEGLDTVTQRVDLAEKDIQETNVKVEEIDNKTMINAPRWSRDLTKIMNPESEHDWRLLAQRLGYSNDDIRAWASQHDPCMAVLSEWYATHKTREANYAVLTALQEMNRLDGAAIVENAMKAVVDVVEDEEVDYASPPPVFLSYQWGLQNEVKLLRNHLQMAGYECWMDIGQMGGGDKLFEKIDNGIRGAKVIISCVSEKYAASPNCNREVNLSVSLGKPIIPLLMEKMSWPPKGSMGPIFSEYLFIRFFQRGGEETKDDRIWPVAKFQEMLMQLNLYGIPPDQTAVIDDMYKNWWIPVQEVIVIDKNKTKNVPAVKPKEEDTADEKKSPEIFLSYQWGKQKQIMALYQRLTGMGFHVWMDIHQMGGGDSLYEKIDSGVRGCKVVLTCITQKYSLSANCRREVSLADALKKPIVPLLLEKMDWPPAGPMSMVFTQLLFINFYRDEEVQMTWLGPKFDELLQKVGEHVPMILPADNHQREKKVSKNESVENTQSNKSGDKNEKSKEETSKSKEVPKSGPQAEKNNGATPRPVSSRNRRGAGGPQPTENRPSPVKTPRPVASEQPPAAAEPQQSTHQEKPREEKKKSKSCTLL